MSGLHMTSEERNKKFIAEADPILDKLGTELLLLDGNTSDLSSLVSILERFSALKGLAEKYREETSFQMCFACEEILSGILCERLPNPAELLSSIMGAVTLLRERTSELSRGEERLEVYRPVIENMFTVLDVPVLRLPAESLEVEEFIFVQDNTEPPAHAESMPTMEATPVTPARSAAPDAAAAPAPTPEPSKPAPSQASQQTEEVSYGLPENMEDPSIYKEYVVECQEHLETIEEKILELENNPHDINLIGEIFRPIHSMKGGAGFLGMTAVNKLAHDTETLLDRCRKSTISITPELVEICLRSIDSLRQMTDNLARYLESGLTDEVKLVSYGPIRRDIQALLQGDSPSSAAPQQPAPQQPAPSAPPAAPKPVSAPPKAPVSQAIPQDVHNPEYASTGLPESFGDADDIDLLKRFVLQSHEHLETIEEDILRLEKETENTELVNGVFRAIHSIKGDSGFLNLMGISKLAHEFETLLDRFRKKTQKPNQRAIELSLQASDALKQMIANLNEALQQNPPTVASGAQPIVYGPIRQAIREVLDNPESTPDSGKPPKIGEILVTSGAVSSETLEEALELQGKPLGELLIQAGKVTPADVEQALSLQDKPVGEILLQTGKISPDTLDKALEKQVEAGGAGAPAGITHSIKVDTDKIDLLVNLVGELVIIEAQVSQMASRAMNGGNAAHQDAVAQIFEKNLSHLGKITKELQDRSMSLRMMPIRQTFQKMTRLVRDASKKMNKKVNLLLVGEDTELDKTVVEQIGDPLVHMLRNSVDHGVESPEERLAAGKPETGTIHLEAFYQGDRIMIRVRDDGKGLDRERIIAKAIETGLLHDNASHLSDAEVFKFIFAPGFSTAKEVTDISGRGVGMDVVRRNIEKLRGQIDVASEKGKGTTITISLPLTLAIIDGMIVKVGEEEYIIPTVSICESIRPRREDIHTVTNRGEMINVRSALVPLIRLHSMWNIEARFTDPCESLVVLVENDNRRVCLMVDELVGQQQIVIKNLGEQFGDVRGIAGATILGNGRVGLILDVNGLIKRSQEM